MARRRAPFALLALPAAAPLRHPDATAARSCCTHQGELLDGGGDVSKAETAQDVIYVRAPLQILQPICTRYLARHADNALMRYSFCRRSSWL
jgi:hypothetical protein